MLFLLFVQEYIFLIKFQRRIC